MNILWDEVQEHVASARDASRGREDDEMRTSSATHPHPNMQEPQQLSIAEITRLIESGHMHLIPNTRTIPEHLNVRRLSLSVSVFSSTPITYPPVGLPVASRKHHPVKHRHLNVVSHGSNNSITKEGVQIRFARFSGIHLWIGGACLSSSCRSMESGSTHRTDGW